MSFTFPVSAKAPPPSSVTKVERIGIVCYTFLANQKLTRTRPADERRFQVTYGENDHYPPQRYLHGAACSAYNTRLSAAFGYSADAERQFTAFPERNPRIINLLTVQEFLDEEFVQNI